MGGSGLGLAPSVFEAILGFFVVAVLVFFLSFENDGLGIKKKTKNKKKTLKASELKSQDGWYFPLSKAARH